MREEVTGASHSDSHSLLWMTEGRSVLAKSDKMTWCFEWMLRREKFFENALKASSSRNWIWDKVGSDEEEAPERRGFRAGVDLRLGAIDMTNVNNREGEKEGQSEKSQTFSNISNILKRSTYAWEMHEHVTCKRNFIMGSAQSKSTSTQPYSTHLNAWQDHYNANVMQCMRF